MLPPFLERVCKETRKPKKRPHSKWSVTNCFLIKRLEMRLSNCSFLSLAFLFACAFLFVLLFKKKATVLKEARGVWFYLVAKMLLILKETMFQFNDALAKSSDQKPIPLGSQIAPHLAMDTTFLNQPDLLQIVQIQFLPHLVATQLLFLATQ